MSDTSRLYHFSESTKSRLREFRLTTSRVSTPQAIVLSIDKKTQEISILTNPQSSSPTTGTNQQSNIFNNLITLTDSLPENSPRYILLSYPLTLKDESRKITPYVMLSYMPENVSNEMRMIYAGARELVANEAGVAKVINVLDEDEILDIEALLR